MRAQASHGRPAGSDDGSEPGKDLLAVMLAARDDVSNEQMTDQQLVDECVTFLVAGHETTAKLLTWGVYLLARFPEWQQRLREEVWQVMGEHGDAGEGAKEGGEEGEKEEGARGKNGGGGVEVAWEQVAQLRQMHMVLLETLRLFPPTPTITREASKVRPARPSPYVTCVRHPCQQDHHHAPRHALHPPFPSFSPCLPFPHAFLFPMPSFSPCLPMPSFPPCLPIHRFPYAFLSAMPSHPFLHAFPSFSPRLPILSSTPSHPFPQAFPSFSPRLPILFPIPSFSPMPSRPFPHAFPCLPFRHAFPSIVFPMPSIPPSLPILFPTPSHPFPHAFLFPMPSPMPSPLPHFPISRAHQDVSLGPYSIPAGTRIMMSLAMPHSDPRYWGEDALHFNPARFKDGIQGACSHPQAFVPFSAGPRDCIGSNFALTEAKVVLAHLLRRLQWELSPTYVHLPSVGITLTPKYGMPLRMRLVE
ncbi:unnamed protein product [Closterium sp. NIES-64]|nr:unnamed protein product [Closterium sp. NIES-64]